SQQASTYQGNLIGNARVEAKTALEALQAKTISLQTEANTQLGRLASSFDILRIQETMDMAFLATRISALQRELEALSRAMNTLQPMMTCLRDRERGPIDPWGVLYQALQQGQYEEASMAAHLNSPLLDVNREGDQGNTLLHLTIKQGKIALSRILINKGATVNVRDLSSKTPLHYATEASNQAAISLLLESGAEQDLPPSWQLQGSYDTAGKQVLLTISDIPERLQQSRDLESHWRITSTTWSGGLSGQMAPNLALNLGENRIPLTVEMTTLTELPSLQLVLQGPDRAFRHTAITLTEMCITKLSDVAHQLAGQIEKVDQYIQESNTVIHDENNTDKKARVTTLLERIRAFKEQY
ncbi:MAG: ankyrin repeat domain-containing protein, partial [Bacteroidota bacterium]